MLTPLILLISSVYANQMAVTSSLPHLSGVVSELCCASEVQYWTYWKRSYYNNVLDSWLSGLAFVDTTDSVHIDHNAERLTVVNVDVTQHDTVTSGAEPFDFSVQGSQILLDRCTGKGNSVFYVATQSHFEGPIVVLHCRFSGDGMIEGHQRWSIEDPWSNTR